MLARLQFLLFAFFFFFPLFIYYFSPYRNKNYLNLKMTKKSLLEIVSERQYLSFNPLKKLLSFIKFSLLLSYTFLFSFFFLRSFKNICRWFSLLRVKHLTSRLFSFFLFPSFYSKSRLCFDFDNCERQL